MAIDLLEFVDFLGEFLHFLLHKNRQVIAKLFVLSQQKNDVIDEFSLLFVFYGVSELIEGLIHLCFLLVFSIWVLCFVYCHSALLPKF